jgi:hypothetical protein
MTTKKPHPVLRALLPPVQTPKHREDRLKALAGAFQTAAMSLIGIGIFTPLLTAAYGIRWSHVAVIAVVAGAIEAMSLTFLMFIPYSENKEDSENG